MSEFSDIEEILESDWDVGRPFHQAESRRRQKPLFNKLNVTYVNCDSIFGNSKAGKNKQNAKPQNYKTELRVRVPSLRIAQVSDREDVNKSSIRKIKMKRTRALRPFKMKSYLDTIKNGDKRKSSSNDNSFNFNIWNTPGPFRSNTTRQPSGEFSLPKKNNTASVNNKYDPDLFADSDDDVDEESTSPILKPILTIQNLKNMQHARRKIFPAKNSETNKVQLPPLSTDKSPSSLKIESIESPEKATSDLSAQIISISSEDAECVLTARVNSKKSEIYSFSEQKDENNSKPPITKALDHPGIYDYEENNVVTLKRYDDKPELCSPGPKRWKPPPGSLSARWNKLKFRARSDCNLFEHERFMLKFQKRPLSYVPPADIILLKILDFSQSYGSFFLNCENICENQILKSKCYTVLMHNAFVPTITIKKDWNIKIFQPFKIYELQHPKINVINNVFKFEMINTDNKKS